MAYSGPNVAARQTKVVGNDWQFSMSATASNVAYNLSGYTCNGTLHGPLNVNTSLAGMFDQTPARVRYRQGWRSLIEGGKF